MTDNLPIEEQEEHLTEEQRLRNELNALPMEELHSRLIALAMTYGAGADELDGNPAEALKYLSNEVDRVSSGRRDPNTKRRPYWVKSAQAHPEDWALYRAAMRIHALTSQLLGENDGQFVGDFSGAGDSGNYDVHTGDSLIDQFLMKMLDRHVHFDWYNNDGGFGDIAWDVQNDVITINGSQYVTETMSVMDEVEF